jgi:gamma-butyrobetaine dioxygenase
MIGQALIEADGRWLSLRWLDGEVSRLPAVWLRDNGQDAASRHAGNGQRLFTILDLPADIRIAEALPREGRLDLCFLADGHRTSFDLEWLRGQCRTRPPCEPGWLREGIAPWGSELSGVLPSESWADLRSDDRSLLRWLAAVARYGTALLTDLPCEDGALLRVVERFGYVRETNYGRLFDVRSEVAPTNLAYTGLGLQVHTDNPYRDPVPGLQLLHCLANSADGGDSIVVDGFAAALRLRARDPEAFARLARWPVEFRYTVADTVLVAQAPMLGLAADGELVEIRFNNRSLGTPWLPESEIEPWYAAYRMLAQELESPEFQVTFKLAPGELFIVDNRRVLHGRTGFSGGGHRHLQGCYADRDGLLSTLAVLERRLRGDRS